MKIKTFLNIILILNILFLVSCDSDDTDSGTDTGFDENAILSVTETSATSVRFNIDAVSTENLEIGIKAGAEDEYTFISANSRTYNQLTPGSLYEASLFSSSSETETPFEIIEFITPPLDIIDSANSETSTVGIKSFPGFDHELILGIEDLNFSGRINSDFVLELVNTDDNSISREIDYDIDGNILKFSVPDNILDDTIFSESSYYLRYSINDNSGFFVNPDFSDLQYLITVFDPNPSFFSLSQIETDNCDGNNLFEIRFIGGFLNAFDFSNSEIHDEVNLTITNLENDDEILLNEEISSNTNCVSGFSFISSASFSQTEEGLRRIHTRNIMIVSLFESLRFTSGDYSIKASFNNGENNFKETEEFEFTIP